MRPTTTSAATRRARLLAALVVLGLPRGARADDVSDEFTAGAISSTTRRSNSPYVSNRIGGSIDATDELSLSLDGTFTRYFKANHEPGENIFQVVAAADYAPDDHWSFGIDARGSPASTAVIETASGPVRSRTSLLGAGASVEYDTGDKSEDAAGNDEVTKSDAETILESYFGVTSYSTTQRALGGKSSPSSLIQFRVSAGVTEILWKDTDGSLYASWYAYSTDPSGTGYFGASVFGRESVSEGLPLEPLRWSLRPGVRQRFGPVRVGAYFQYGRYVDDAGWNALGGLKAQIKVSEAWKLWVSGNLQRDVPSTGEALLIPWASVGARVTF